MEQFFNELTVQIFGEYSLAFYVAYFFFVLFGVLLSSAIVAMRTRDVSSTRSPESFSFSFLLKDNLLRIFTTMSVVFLTVRFGAEFFNVVPTHFGAITLGFSFDLIIIQLEKIKAKATRITKILFLLDEDEKILKNN